MKLGLDLHGVITDRPEFFSELSKIFIDNGHEVHIVTGGMINDSLLNKINSAKI